jgi:hypothetical protein
MTPAIRRAAAPAAVVAALALAACSSPLSSGPPTATTAPPTTTTVKGASTPAQTKAAGYRAQLTYLMVEQVYLLGRVTQQVAAAGSGASSASTTSTTPAAQTTTPAAPTPAVPDLAAGDATAALDKNSHDITDWLAQAQGYGATFDAAFYPLWTERIADFEAYAKAKSAGDAAGTTAATTSLTENATAIATLVHGVNRFVAVATVTNPGTGLADELGPDNQGVTALIDAQASGSSGVPVALVKAAELMYHTSDFLAAAASKLDPDQYPGTADGTAANLRASLTMAFVEHVELLALDLDALTSGQPTGPWAAAVAANTDQLRDAMSINYSDQTGDQFATRWTAYIDDLAAYTKAKESGDNATAATASGRLSGVAAGMGTFINAQPGHLSADVVAGDISPIVNGLQAVADAAATHQPDVILTREAAGFVPKLGSDLSESMAIQHPTLYAP